MTLVDTGAENSGEIVAIFRELTKTYWPGPLTIVVKANAEWIGPTVTAGTGFVGLRMPRHDIALNLMKKANLPLAAPSANKFGHISPTKAEHVYNDFYKDSGITILDGG